MQQLERVLRAAGVVDDGKAESSSDEDEGDEPREGVRPYLCSLRNADSHCFLLLFVLQGPRTLRCVGWYPGIQLVYARVWCLVGRGFPKSTNQGERVPRW